MRKFLITLVTLSCLSASAWAIDFPWSKNKKIKTLTAPVAEPAQQVQPVIEPEQPVSDKEDAVEEQAEDLKRFSDQPQVHIVTEEEAEEIQQQTGTLSPIQPIQLPPRPVENPNRIIQDLNALRAMNDTRNASAAATPVRPPVIVRPVLAPNQYPTPQISRAPERPVERPAAKRD